MWESHSPYALQVEYPDNSQISPVLTKAALPLLDVKPTLAYKLNDYLSVGGGLDIYTFASFLGEGHAEISNKTPRREIPSAFQPGQDLKPMEKIPRWDSTPACSGLLSAIKNTSPF